MHLSCASFAVAASLLATVSAVGQAPMATMASAAATATPPPLDLVTDVESDGRIWAGSESWKASFEATGTTFVPYFGAAAPRSFPTRFGRAAVAVGGEPLPGQDVAPVLAPHTVTFATAAYCELYQLRTEGIEQQFVFETLPNRGAIEVTVPVAGDLAVGNTAGGFSFTGELGSFTYGRAIAIDGNGDRLELETHWTGAALVTTVPQWFVAHAALPLVIDPLVGNVTSLTADTKVLRSLDMAFDESMGRYALVYERVFSATDSDVFARYFDTAMLPLGQVTIDVTTNSWRDCRIAGLAAHDRFLVVASTSTGNVSPFRISSRLLSGSTPVVGAVVSQFANYAHDAIHPDVGGDTAAAPSQFLVLAETVFQATDHDIVAQFVQADGTSASLAFAIDAGYSFEASPVIGKTCGAPGGGSEAWGITYRRDDLGAGTSAQYVATVDRSGVLLQVPGPLPGTFPTVGSSIAVSSPTDHELGRNFLAVRASVSGGSAAGLQSHAFDRTGSIVASGPFTSVTAPPFGPVDVDSDGARFLMTMSFDDTGVPGNAQAHAELLGIVGSQVRSQDWRYLNNPGRHTVAVVSRHSGGGVGHEFGLAWVEDVLPTSARLQASRYDGVQPGAQFALRATGCGGIGLSTSGNGSTALGESFTLQHTAPPGLTGFVVGLPVDLPVGPCPGCRQGANGSTLFGTSYSFTIPRNAAFVGLTLAFQGFHIALPGAAGACLAQINLTDTLDATLR